MDRLSDDRWKTLLQAAEKAARNAYCPHSGFAVGAALLGPGDAIHVGCNVENVSYGLTNCAERTAVFSAVAAGMSPGQGQGLALYTPTQVPVSPCGACRQVLAEFMEPDAPVRAYCDGPDHEEWSVAELLPYAFGFDPKES